MPPERKALSLWSYTYDALGRRLTMTDRTGETVYGYDGLGRLTSVTTYRKPAANGSTGSSKNRNAGSGWNSGSCSTGNAWNGGNGSAGSTGNTSDSSNGSETAASIRNTGSAFSHAEGSGDTIGYTYNEANDLAAITYPDGTKVSYEYDPNGNLTRVTGRRGEVTTYEYDALNRPVAEHRPNGISTYKTYNARNQITELTNQCDDCGWVLGHYVYTYDNRGNIVGEHAEEAREMDPYGRERYTPYVPERQGENCGHGKNKSLSYRLLTTDSTFTYDEAGKLLTAVEAEAGCSTATVWTYSHDLMGNLTEKAQYKVEKTLLEGMEEVQNGDNSSSNGEEAPDGTANSQKGASDLPDESLGAQDKGNGSTNNASLTEETVKFNNSTEIFDIVSKIDAVSREKYAYNENNQLSEATICDGKTTKKVCYTYDEDGNLLTEYSPTDRSQTTYQYTVEDRLEAVYKGNAYNKNLQMAAAYDGDGNRVYQLNYNPEKDEDFSDYYCSYQACDYNGTGMQLQVSGEVSQAEKDLIALFGASGAVRNSSYELIEYINDVNREYMEVLVEQNINGRIDTVYTYGNERISREMFQQTNRTSYYLYDPRGSVSGLTDAKAHLTQTYRYSANGELTYGGARYENEYTYNGESYNPNIHSQYLRARYYNVTSARFLTEDSYLGDIAEPLTLNRYNYCVSSWLNYQDPSGFYTYHQGSEAHRALQEDIERHFPNAKTEYWVTGYPYSPTGKGRIDILLETPDGMEVYEIKPAWQKSSYEKEGNFLLGWQQRDGYISALRSKKEKVNRDGTSLNSYVNGKKLPIVDSYYDTVTYFTVPGQPGIIYYSLQRQKKKPEPAIALSTEKAEAMSKVSVRDCEPVKIRQRKRKPVTLKKELNLDRWPEKEPTLTPYEQMEIDMLYDNYRDYARPIRKGIDLNGLNGPFYSVSEEELMEITGIAAIVLLILEFFKEALPLL